jgi:ABC-type amino acid transport substrate-binding protein
MKIRITVNPNRVPVRFRTESRIRQIICFTLFVAFAIAGSTCLAQSDGDSKKAMTSVNVGIIIEAPFIKKYADGHYGGYSFELWEQIERKLGLKSNFREFDNFAALLEGVSSGTVDIAVADIFVTSERERIMEFTHPIADGGLRIMINSDSKHSFKRILNGLVENGHMAIFGYGSVLVVVLSFLLMFFWRRIDKDFPSTAHDGFAEAFYRIVSLTVSGKTKVSSVSTWYTKILSAVWLVFGVGIVAYITSSVTAVMTVESIRYAVNDVEDLGGKPVGAVKGTFGESYCLKRGFEVTSYATLEEAVHGLVSRNIVAIIDDAPLLEAYDHAHPELAISETGPLFEKRKYAFALPRDSHLRHQINIALVELDEAGEVKKLYSKYFNN